MDFYLAPNFFKTFRELKRSNPYNRAVAFFMELLNMEGHRFYNLQKRQFDKKDIGIWFDGYRENEIITENNFDGLSFNDICSCFSIIIVDSQQPCDNPRGYLIIQTSQLEDAINKIHYSSPISVSRYTNTPNSWDYYLQKVVYSGSIIISDKYLFNNEYYEDNLVKIVKSLLPRTNYINDFQITVCGRIEDDNDTIIDPKFIHNKMMNKFSAGGVVIDGENLSIILRRQRKVQHSRNIITYYHRISCQEGFNIFRKGEYFDPIYISTIDYHPIVNDNNKSTKEILIATKKFIEGAGEGEYHGNKKNRILDCIEYL